MPSSIVQRTTDVERYRQALRPTDAEFLVTARGRFSGTVTKLDLHRLWMSRLQESLPRTWCIQMFPDRSAISFFTAPGPAIHANGIEVRSTEVALLRASATFSLRSTAASYLGSMSLPIEDMAEISIALAGRDLGPRDGVLSMRAEPSRLARLLRLHEAAGRLAETAPEIVSNLDAARGLEQILIDAMIGCLSHGLVQEDSASRRRHSTIIRRFRTFAEEHPEEPLYLADVCAAIGVNRRTLHYCCLEQLG
jgi:hypothetical protein